MTVTRVALLSLIPVMAGVVGGVIAATMRPRDAVRSAIQHFAAGVVFAAAAIELLPRVREQSMTVAIVGFGAGTFAMLLLRHLTHKLEVRGSNASWGLIAAVTADVIIDGLVTGAGFALGERTGILLIVALVLEFLFLGLAMSGSMGDNASWWRVVAVPSVVSALTLPAAVVGYLVLGSVSPATLGVFLGFGTVALMYLVTEELLREAHESTDSAGITAMFFLGFLLFLLISHAPN